MSTTTRPRGYAVNTYSYTLQSPVRECLQGLAAQGFHEFELMMYPGHLWPADIGPQARRELRDFIVGNDLIVTTLNMPNIDLNIAAATVEMRDMTLKHLRAVVALAGDLGAAGVVVGPGKANPLLPMPKAQLVEHFHRALAQLVPLAAQAGTSVFVENMPFAFLPYAADLLDAVEQFGDARVGIVYDVANGHFVKEDVCAALRMCAPRLRVVHLSDTTQTVYRHDAIGLGTVDFGPLPVVLNEIGFRRAPILEIIDPDPDLAIERSAAALDLMGWQAVAAAN